MIELRSGQMAEINLLTKKALRVYQEAGLLEPTRIDDQNGYRYYQLDESATIDMIQQLQSLGFSLSDIRDLLKQRDGLIPALEQQQAALQDQMVELLIAQQNVQQLLNNCKFMTSGPVYDTVIMEQIPERYVLYFDIFNDRARRIAENVSTVLDEWELNLRLTKKHMVERGIPVALFHNVGCLVTKDNLEKGNLEISKSFIIIDDERVAEKFDAEIRPAGTYTTLLKRNYTEANGDSCANAEREGILALIDYIGNHGLSIDGDYHGVILGETPMFHYQGREMLLKLEIPVVACC